PLHVRSGHRRSDLGVSGDVEHVGRPLLQVRRLAPEQRVGAGPLLDRLVHVGGEEHMRLKELLDRRPADDASEVVVDPPAVTGEALTQRALEELDPSVLHEDQRVPEAEEETPAPRLLLVRAARRAVLAACWMAVVSVVTKGDANTGVERWKVSADGTLGRVEYHVWHLGYLLYWMRGPLGRILLVVLPALLLGVYELIRIWRPREQSDTDEAEEELD